MSAKIFFKKISVWSRLIFFSSTTVVPGVFNADRIIDDLTCADPRFSTWFWANGILVPWIVIGNVFLPLGKKNAPTFSKGVITLEVVDEEKGEELGLIAIDAGAEDIDIDDGVLEIHTPPENLQDVRQALAEENVNLDSAQISMVPKSTILLESHAAEQTLKLLDNLEELEDIQKAYTNADFPPEVLEKYQSES